MFGYGNEMVPYEDRVVGRHENDATDLLVSTAEVFDSPLPFETAVAHPRYNSGKIVVVATYGDRESAAEGHEKWVARMNAEQLPTVLEDVSGFFAAELIRVLGSDMIFELESE